jgi:hypothetical protein
LPFFEVLDAALRAAVPGTLGVCVVDDVEYAPRVNNYRDHTAKHCAFLKPDGPPRYFERESEVRAVWIPKGFMPEPLILEIGSVRALLEPWLGRDAP